MQEGVTIFDEKFLSHSAEKLRKGLQLFLKKFWFRKVLWMKRGVSRFPSNFFGLTVLKNFVGITSMLQKNRDIENIYA